MNKLYREIGLALLGFTFVGACAAYAANEGTQAKITEAGLLTVTKISTVSVVALSSSLPAPTGTDDIELEGTPE